MELVGEDREAVRNAVNQCIDSHLEACFVPARGDVFTPAHKLLCKVSRPSMLVLCRRLMETDEGSSLVSSIASTLDILAVNIDPILGMVAKVGQNGP